MSFNATYSSLRKKDYRDFQELEGLPARTEIEVKQNMLPCVAIVITKTVFTLHK